MAKARGRAREPPCRAAVQTPVDTGSDASATPPSAAFSRQTAALHAGGGAKASAHRKRRGRARARRKPTFALVGGPCTGKQTGTAAACVDPRTIRVRTRRSCSCAHPPQSRPLPLARGRASASLSRPRLPHVPGGGQVAEYTSAVLPQARRRLLGCPDLHDRTQTLHVGPRAALINFETRCASAPGSRVSCCAWIARHTRARCHIPARRP